LPKYYFHLRNGSDQLLDPRGTELASIEAVRQMALLFARDTLSNMIRGGLLDLRYRVDAEDADGKLVHSIKLEDTFETVREK
jgi:hypothetical protein